MIVATGIGPGIVTLALLMALGGCAGRRPLPPPAEPAKVAVAVAELGGEAKPVAPEASDRPLMPERIAPGESVYFAPRACDIDSDGTALLRRCADHLKLDERRRVTLVGVTDDLGSRTYNLAMADRRISTVQLALRRMGVTAYQIKRRNLGGEMPRSRCGDESCRKQMRRVEVHCGD